MSWRLPVRRAFCLAHCNSPAEKSPLHGIARERNRGAKVPARSFPFFAAKLEFAQCREIKGVRDQAIAIAHRRPPTADRPDLVESGRHQRLTASMSRAL